MSRFTRFALIGFLCLVMNIIPAQAQNSTVTPESTWIVLEFKGSTLLVRSIQSSGELLTLAEIPNTTLKDTDIQTDWNIYSTDHLTVSPSNEFIAYAAFSAQENALFIYDITTTTLEKYTISSATLKPHWSPDETAVLLYTPVPYLGYEEAIPDDYLFDLVSGTLTQLTNTPDFIEHEWQWAADSKHLMYVGGRNNRHQIFQISRDGEPTQLTQFTETDPYSLCGLHSHNKRWYFIAGCQMSFGIEEKAIYSITANGDIQLEFSLLEWLNLDTTPLLSDFSINIGGYFWQGDEQLSVFLAGTSTPSTLIARSDDSVPFKVLIENIPEEYILVAQVNGSVFFKSVSQEGTQVVQLNLDTKSFTSEYQTMDSICHIEATSNIELLLVISNTPSCNDLGAAFTQVMVLDATTLTPVRQFDLDPQNTSVSE